MRIVIVSRIFAPEPSAASFVLLAIAREFRDAGHRVTVLTTRPPSSAVPQEIPGVTVRRAPVLRDKSGYVRGYLPYLSFDVPLFFRLLLTRRADLYVVEPPPTTGAITRVALAMLRRPYVYDAADVWSDAAKLATSSSVVLALLRRVELFALRGARRAFTISAGVSDRLRELDVATPTTIIGFGVDSDVFHYVRPSDPAPAPYFVYAGTYSEWHGARIFVDAFARFSAVHPGYRLLFIGNGAERSELEASVVRAGLGSVEFREPIDGESLNLVFADATASLASLKPGQGYDYAFTTKIYSSLAAGCPVVFAGVGPTVDFIERASANHPVGTATSYDVAAIETALVAAVESSPAPAQRSKMSDWAGTQFSLAAIARVVVAESVRDAVRS